MPLLDANIPSVDALNARARALRYRDPRGAVDYSTRAVAAAEEASDVGGCIRALRIRSGCLAHLADLEGAHRDLDRAATLLKDTKDDSERGWLLTTRAHVLPRHGGLAEGMTAAQQALDLHKSIGNRIGEGESLNIAGAIADQLGDHARALELFQESRHVFEEANEIDGLYSVLSNIATIHARLGEHGRAIEQLEHVLSLSTHAGNQWHESLIHLNLGAVHSAAGSADQALAHTNACLRMARAIGERSMEVQALTNLGEILLRQGHASIAREHLVEALAPCVSLGLRPIEVEIRTLLGEAQVLLGEYVDAEEQLQSALAIAQIIGSRFFHDIQLALSNLYSARGDFARALHHHRLFHEAKETAWGARPNQRIRASIVEAETKQSEHVALELRERNDRLVAANEEKTQLLATLAEQAAALERLSLEDALTGVHNRRYFDAQLSREWERCNRFSHPLSVAILDVDHFKMVNDSYGHAAGDAVLSALGTYLRSHTRRVDIVARYGGEEFALVFVETPLAVAAALCEQLRADIAALDCTQIAEGLRISVSIGVAATDDATSPSSLLMCADGRLYDAKRGGRNNVRSG